MVLLFNYMDQIKSLHPLPFTENAPASEELESQDSLDMAMNWGRMELIIVRLLISSQTPALTL